MSSFWLFLTFLIILKQHFIATEMSVPPAPTLTQTNIIGSDVELLCQAPQGHSGLVFQLFKLRELINTVNHLTNQREARFTLKGENTKKENLYCCQYGYSMYSKYMSPQPKAVDPVSPPPSPHLAVDPSSGRVMPGQMLSFYCQAPDSRTHPPDAFLLLQKDKAAPIPMVAPAKLMSQSQEARFDLKTIGQENGGEYFCFYQLKSPKMVNSTLSSPVQITVIELPVPTLSLSEHEGNVLECVGSPSYPQSIFYLFRMGSLSPEATRMASMTQYSAKFPIPAHHGAQYLCQYSVSLGRSHAYSKMSTPLTLPCITGYHKCTATSTGNTDLALIVGSVSAGVLFLMFILLLGFAVHRYVKNKTEKRRQRDRDQFWQQVHFRDHVVDLTLQRIDFGSEDTGQMLRGKPSASEPIYDSPMATFKKPPVY